MEESGKKEHKKEEGKRWACLLEKNTGTVTSSHCDKTDFIIRRESWKMLVFVEPTLYEEYVAGFGSLAAVSESLF